MSDSNEGHVIIDMNEPWIDKDLDARAVLCPDDTCVIKVDKTTTDNIPGDAPGSEDTIIVIEEKDPYEVPKTHKLPPTADQILSEWICIHEANGIVQHSKEWLAAKRYVVGGSKIAMVTGDCPHSVVSNYVREKSMNIHLPMGIAAQWGNLMEEVIKQQVERDYECVVLGENLYVREPKYTGVAYSPDGLAVMNVGSRGSMPVRGGSVCNLLPSAETAVDSIKSPRVILLEFKCPWSRVLEGSPPANYVPQVKMGLDMIRIASLGLLAEAIYRRCTCAQLSTYEFNDEHTQKIKDAPKSPAPHIWCGIIGVFVRAHPIDTSHRLYDKLPQWYEDIQNWRKQSGADFGKMPADVFAGLIGAIDRHELCTWYPVPTMPAKDAIHEFMGCCAAAGTIPLGVIPWKLIRIDYHWIAPEYGYVEKVGPRIDLINTAVLSAVNNPRDAHNIVEDFDKDWEAMTGVSAKSRGSMRRKDDESVKTTVEPTGTAGLALADTAPADTATGGWSAPKPKRTYRKKQ